ncbi:MAG: hypothetical protein J6A52_04610 [Bacilli bacterium]|nr:hypothetical protein [Bacilli bacterium]
MKRKDKIGEIIILFSMTLIIISLLLYLDLNNYLLVVATFSIVILINLLLTIINNRSNIAIYNNKINNILKTYDSVIKKCSTIPNLENKTIEKTNNIDILFDEQNLQDNYIYCLKEEKCCSFFLVQQGKIIFHTIKLEESILSMFE